MRYYIPNTTQATLQRLYMHLYKVSLKLKENLSQFKALSQKWALHADYLRSWEAECEDSCDF